MYEKQFKKKSEFSYKENGSYVPAVACPFCLMLSLNAFTI